MLKASHLKKTFRAPTPIEILKSIDLEVLPNQTIAIMGSSGVGKSTLLHILGTLEKPDSGTLEIKGKLTGKNNDRLRNREVGFIFQSFFLLENQTVLENVLMPAKIARLSTKVGSQAHLRALHLLEKVGLSDRKHQLAKNLSGGEKQRTCIARALCNNPSLLFADEPTGNLDQTTSHTIQKLLLDTAKEENKALIVATHDRHFANLCDFIYELKAGQLELLKHP
jgi:lipoprotein-releasing system ATP-binding protein